MNESLMTPYPGSPLSLGLEGMVDTPTPEMQRSVEAGIERQLRLRRGMLTEAETDQACKNVIDWMKFGFEYAEKRRALCENAPTCTCGSKQVQLLAWIDNVLWRCRDCKLTFEGN